MASRKRRIEEVVETGAEERGAKQQKTDAAVQNALESNSDASYVSAAAAVFDDSDIASQSSQSSAYDSDSGLSTSSEEPSSESEDDDSDSEASVRSDGTPAHTPRRTPAVEEITNVRLGGKPNMKKEPTDKSLIDKIRSFLPQMEEGNRQLERERQKGTLSARNMEDEDGEGEHIELDLGLGVLEEKHDDSDSDEEDTEAEAMPSGRDILSKLMGIERSRDIAPPVQEVGDG